MTTIVGPNAYGKTNILEAIYLLALTKSFRTSKQQDLIMWEKDFCRVQGVFEIGNEDMELEIFFGRPPQPLKSLKINGVKTSAVKFIGNCQIVFFHPEDMNILYLGPSLRRRYLDILNIQINSKYYAALRAYNRVLEQRNALLKHIKEGICRSEDLNVWDEQLAEHGGFLVQERAATIQFLNEGITDIYNGIAGSKNKVSVEYLCSGDACDADFTEVLTDRRRTDIEARFTTAGPHRDDFSIHLNGKPLDSHASRGEYRSMLLSLKLLELQFYEQKSSEKPLLLLDDVFSELDEDRQRALLVSIKGCQTIITATHVDENGAGTAAGNIEKIESIQAGLKV